MAFFKRMTFNITQLLKHHNFHTYKLQITQEFEDEDLVKRIEYCETMTCRNIAQPQLSNRYLLKVRFYYVSKKEDERTSCIMKNNCMFLTILKMRQKVL